MLTPLRWLWKNTGTLLLSFALALAVWLSAVISADPNVECEALQKIPLKVIAPDPRLKLSGKVPENINVLLLAPRSVCDLMIKDPTSVQASMDLSSLDEGTHSVSVDLQISDQYHPLRLLEVDPVEIELSLEAILTREYPIMHQIVGEPAVGYTAGQAIWSGNPDASRVTVTGPRSVMEQVVEARVVLDITDAEADLQKTVPVMLLDKDGNPVPGLSFEPDRLTVTQPIVRPSTYRDVIVKVTTIGQVAEGYQLTNISVTPPVITVFSSDPELVRLMPGFVETMPLDLTGATDDIERRLTLLLPEGVSAIKNQSVLVQVSIAAIETSKPLFALPVEVVGLSPGLEAQLFPATVDVILSGPLPILEIFQPDKDMAVIVDLTGFEPGTYTLTPQVEIYSTAVKQESVLPDTIEVTIVIAPTSTPDTSLNLGGTSTATSTATPTSTPTFTPTIVPTPTSKPVP